MDAGSVLLFALRILPIAGVLAWLTLRGTIGLHDWVWLIVAGVVIETLYEISRRIREAAESVREFKQTCIDNHADTIAQISGIRAELAETYEQRARGMADVGRE